MDDIHTHTHTHNMIRWIEYIVLYYVILICTDNAYYSLVDKVLMIDTSRYPNNETSRIARFRKEIFSQGYVLAIYFIYIFIYIR